MYYSAIVPEVNCKERSHKNIILGVCIFGCLFKKYFNNLIKINKKLHKVSNALKLPLFIRNDKNTFKSLSEKVF